VRFGLQTFEEMMFGFVEMVYGQTVPGAARFEIADARCTFSERCAVG
jgi:hypothetical protein